MSCFFQTIKNFFLEENKFSSFFFFFVQQHVKILNTLKTTNIIVCLSLFSMFFISYKKHFKVNSDKTKEKFTFNTTPKQQLHFLLKRFKNHSFFFSFMRSSQLLTLSFFFVRLNSHQQLKRKKLFSVEQTQFFYLYEEKRKNNCLWM